MENLSITVSDGIGLAGVSCVLMAYFLLQLERVRSDGLGYLLLNLVGASLLIVSLMVTFNLASFVIEICWLAISLFGLAKLGWRQFRKQPS
jgi:predicted membrane protein